MFPTPGTKQKIGQSFPRGTTLLFYQATAPLGWTKLTTQNDKALRVVSGSGGVSGGTNSFSTVMAQTVVGNTTISTSTLPTLNAQGVFENFSSGTSSGQTGAAGGATLLQLTPQFAGSGGSHNHGITMSIQYIDLILASKN